MNLTPATLEGRIVRLSDKIAYVNADFDDGIRAQLLREEDIPLELRRELGFDTKSRLDHLIHDIIINSMDKDDIVMSEASWQAFLELRKFMFANLYTNPVAKAEEVKAEAMIERLYFYYMEHEELLPQKLRRFLEDGEELSRIVCDYISGMTDQYAITKFEEFYIPVAWQVDGY
jgi:dGTPase